MRNIPVLLLDIDGVINANRPGWSAAPSRTNVPDNKGHVWSMKFDRRVITNLYNLHHKGIVEMRLCSTWVVAGKNVLISLGLPDIAPAFDINDDASRNAMVFAKTMAAVDVVDSGRPLIWIDDDSIPVDGDNRDKLDAAGALLIAPKSNRGLRPDDFDLIDTWIANLSK